jgi:hypothetical protein
VVECLPSKCEDLRSILGKKQNKTVTNLKGASRNGILIKMNEKY